MNTMSRLLSEIVGKECVVFMFVITGIIDDDWIKVNISKKKSKIKTIKKSFISSYLHCGFIK